MFKIYYQLNKYNKNLSLIKKTHKKKAKSFLYHFSQVLAACFGSAIGTIHRYPSGDSSNVQVGTDYSLAVVAYDGNTTSFVDNGIMLGTGSTAININDYALTTPISHGTTTGCLEYLNCGVRNYTVNVGTNTGSFEVFRMFRNSSGANITITELGLVQYYCYYYYSSGYYYQALTIRDLVEPGFTIMNGEYMKVTYTFQIIS